MRQAPQGHPLNELLLWRNRCRSNDEFFSAALDDARQQVAKVFPVPVLQSRPRATSSVR